MYLTLRRYPTIGTARSVIERSVADELLPEFRRQPGFRAYCAFWDDEDAGVSVSIFADPADAQLSIDAARRWVMRHQDFFPDRGEEFSGDCFVQAEAPATGPAAPYSLVRTLSGVPGTQDTRAFVEQRTLPMITRAPGFRAVFMLRHDREATRAAVVTLFDSRAQAEASHAKALELLAEGLPQVRLDQVMQGPAVIAARGEPAIPPAGRP